MKKLCLTEKETGDIYEIYDISYNKNGYPHFLVYKDGQWMRMSAKHFKPKTKDKEVEELENKLRAALERFEWKQP